MPAASGMRDLTEHREKPLMPPVPPFCRRSLSIARLVPLLINRRILPSDPNTGGEWTLERLRAEILSRTKGCCTYAVGTGSGNYRPPEFIAH